MKFIGVFFLIGNISTWAAFGSNDSKINQDAFVYILNIGIEAGTQNSLQYRGLRNGFAVGNGQYVLTAAHCVEDFENTYQILRQPLVLSPYYGDVFEARIVAVDKENDVAILKPAWDIHPALELETQQKTNRTITIAGYPPVSKERGGDGNHCSRSIRLETVTRVHINGRTDISVGPVKYAGEGWSGSALIVPETGRVAGITCIKTSGTKSRELWGFKLPLSRSDYYISGCDSDAIRSLFKENKIPFETSPPLWPEISRRGEFDKILNALDVLDPDKEKQISNTFEHLLKEMPGSFFTCVVPGLILGPVDCKPSFQKAIGMAPQSTFVRAAYGNKLLNQSKPKEAAAQFQLVAEQDPNHVFAHHGRLTALTQTDPNAAELLGKELTERWPLNAAFWFEYSKALRASDKRSEELPLIQKAIELSETVPYLYRRYLADSLTANNRYEEAEQTYEELLKTHECERCWRAYTLLLLEMGPQKGEQARHAIAKARSFSQDPNEYLDYERKLEKMLLDPNTENQ